MAESVLGFILAFAKDLPTTLRLQQHREWRHRETEQVAGKEILVAGMGPVGHSIAEMAGRMGMRATGIARTARPGAGALQQVLEVSDLPAAVATADYVVNALPLTDATFRLFDRSVFERMKPTCRFINVGRGATVDEAALAAALRDGLIAGAALDVFADEPLPPDSPLWDLPGVIVSPHMSGDHVGWQRALVDLFLDNLQRFVEGRNLRNVVDLDRGFGPAEV
jgi:phosphoglycerate dehydrogenase-like enzyme